MIDDRIGKEVRDERRETEFTIDLLVGPSESRALLSSIVNTVDRNWCTTRLCLAFVRNFHIVARPRQRRNGAAVINIPSFFFSANSQSILHVIHE